MYGKKIECFLLRWNYISKDSFIYLFVHSLSVVYLHVAVTVLRGSIKTQDKGLPGEFTAWPGRLASTQSIAIALRRHCHLATCPASQSEGCMSLKEPGKAS